ncbi:MAG: ferrous iron transport protein A [Actinomyces sp.]|nr:ferrous iron transport protein A [Actinomyces sp.]MDN6428666.1 ferrous iron transport protein A [Propionibacterium sp.]MDN6565987.1 ferrous iron transport protein A [Actinomyces sp.]MDN6794433.1 ferrous iron transport protein A [Propionibacterium sp.]
MLLSKCPRNARARLTTIDIDPRHQLRLQELGLRPGAEFTLTNRAAFGGVVMNIAGTRVAVDRRSARTIDVEVLP